MIILIKKGLGIDIEYNEKKNIPTIKMGICFNVLMIYYILSNLGQ
jgi:hypothetical protein